MKRTEREEAAERRGAEQAEAEWVAERDALRAEVERLKAEVERLREVEAM